MANSPAQADPRRSGSAARMRRAVARQLASASASLAGRHVVALCSGGIDSTVLVDVLATLPRGARPARVVVLFCDHGLRDVDDERSAAREGARRHGFEFLEVEAQRRFVMGIDDAPVPNLQALAREWRYAEAERVATRHGCTVIATGHQANDQLETVVYGLVAAGGLAASTGIPLARHLPGNDRLGVVRPLLGQARDEIERYAAERGIEHALDPSNLDPARSARNRIRHEAVPALLAAHPGAAANVERSRQLGERSIVAIGSLVSFVLDSACDPARPATLDVRPLQQLADAARAEVVAEWLRRNGLGRGLSTRVVDQVVALVGPARVAACGAHVDVRGARVRRDRYHLVFTLPATPDRAQPKESPRARAVA